MVEVSRKSAMLSFTKDRRPRIAKEKELKEILWPKVVCAIYIRKKWQSPYLWAWPECNTTKWVWPECNITEM